MPQLRSDHCDRCGASTIHECPHCKQEIRGDYKSDVVLGGELIPVPTHCSGCGAAFPWASAAVLPTVSVKANPIEILEKICLRFHLVARQLRDRHNKRPTIDVQDEYDVQDLIHGLLHIAFDDIRPEEWTPSYAGGSARVDFLLKRESIILEIKKTRAGLGRKEVGDQLLIDIGRYRAHPDCRTLFCFVYDPESRVSNPRGMEHDLSRITDGLAVRVFIVPRGD